MSHHNVMIDLLVEKNGIIHKIKEWLDDEISHNELVLNGEEELTDGTDDIHEGRNECAESLLEQIKKWENKDD